MISDMNIMLQGFPESVQLLAQVLDALFPDAFEWTAAAPASQPERVVLCGRTRQSPIAMDRIAFAFPPEALMQSAALPAFLTNYQGPKARTRYRRPARR